MSCSRNGLKKHSGELAPANKNSKFLFEDSSWDFEIMQRTYDAIEEVALGDLGLDVYPNQI